MLLYTIDLKNPIKYNWRGDYGRVYCDWDSPLLKYGGEVFLGRRSTFYISILICCSSGIQSEVVVVMCVWSCTIDILFKVNTFVNKVISCFCFYKCTMVLTLIFFLVTNFQEKLHHHILVRENPNPYISPITTPSIIFYVVFKIYCIK